MWSWCALPPVFPFSLCSPFLPLPPSSFLLLTLFFLCVCSFSSYTLSPTLFCFSFVFPSFLSLLSFSILFSLCFPPPSSPLLSWLSSASSYFVQLLLAVLGMRSRASDALSKHTTSECEGQLFCIIFIVYWIWMNVIVINIAFRIAYFHTQKMNLYFLKGKMFFV